MKTLLKMSFASIKKSYKRFISILAIVLLGVGFFAGIKATSPDMQDTLNNYYVETILELLRPISCALLFFVFVKLALSTLNDLKAIILLFVFIALSPILKRNPIIYILLSCFSAIIIEVFKPFLM